jgi:drug/metabolite transporter (DMT)-like permease
MKKPDGLVYLEACFAVIVWGGTFIATKMALAEVGPGTIVWLRFGMGVPVLGAVMLGRRQFSLPAKNEWLYFSLLGFLGVTVHQWLQATGLMTAQATTTAWIVASTPVFIAILGWLALKERLNGLQSTGIGIALFGVLLVVSKGDPSGLFSGRRGTIGDLLVFVSAINWAVYTILSRRELARHPPARMMFYVMLLGWAFTNAWIFGFGPGLGELARLSATGWGAILALGIFGSGFAYIAWYDALKAISAAQLGTFLYIEPLVTAILAAALIGEPFHLASLAGGGVILLGVWLVNRG